MRQSSLYRRDSVVRGSLYVSESPPAERVASGSPPEGGKPVAPGKRSAARGVPARRHKPRQGRQNISPVVIPVALSGLYFSLTSRPRAALRLPGATCCAPFQGAGLSLLMNHSNTVEPSRSRLAGTAEPVRVTPPEAVVCLRESNVVLLLPAVCRVPRSMPSKQRSRRSSPVWRTPLSQVDGNQFFRFSWSF